MEYRFVCERVNRFIVTHKMIEGKVHKAMEDQSIKKDGKNSFYMYISRIIPNPGRLRVIQSSKWGSSMISTSLRTGFCTPSMDRWRRSEGRRVFLMASLVDFDVVFHWMANLSGLEYHVTVFRPNVIRFIINLSAMATRSYSPIRSADVLSEDKDRHIRKLKSTLAPLKQQLQQLPLLQQKLLYL